MAYEIFLFLRQGTPFTQELSNWGMRPSCLWDKGPSLHNDFITKVYGIYVKIIKIFSSKLYNFFLI
jgi:hypothetical protein